MRVLQKCDKSFTRVLPIKGHQDEGVDGDKGSGRDQELTQSELMEDLGDGVKGGRDLRSGSRLKAEIADIALPIFFDHFA